MGFYTYITLHNCRGRGQGFEAGEHPVWRELGGLEDCRLRIVQGVCLCVDLSYTFVFVRIRRPALFLPIPYCVCLLCLL